MTRKTVVATFLVAGVLITGAFAKGNMNNAYNSNAQAGQQRFANQSTQPSFQMADSNKDGSISADELDAFRATNMSKNAEDGKLLRNAGDAPQFSDIDKNNDGKITQSEFEAGQRLHTPTR